MQYMLGRDWIRIIHVTPSIFDEDNVEGLCGNPNGKPDDFILQGSAFPTTYTFFFQASWRYMWTFHNVIPCNLIILNDIPRKRGN